MYLSFFGIYPYYIISKTFQRINAKTNKLH